MPADVPRHRSRASVFALLIGLGLTAFTTYLVWSLATFREQTHFDTEVRQVENNLRERIETYLALLRGTAGFVAGTGKFDRAQFSEYVATLAIRKRYPGLQGIGFSLRLRPGELPQIVDWMHSQGVTDFHLWPEGQRDEYHTILSLEPPDRNNPIAIGFDMFSNPIRRAAMERARDSDTATASGKVALVQETGPVKQPGFLIYKAVFRRGERIRTFDERRAALLGFVYAPFRAPDLLSNVVDSRISDEINVDFYDGPAAEPQQLLYSSTGEPESRPRFKTESHIDIAGRPWTITFATRPQFEAGSERSSALAIAVAGVLVTLVLFATTESLARSQARAEQIANELRVSEEEQKRAKEVAERARTEAESANRLKDEFLATVSHELRTPLNAILGWIYLLRTSPRNETDLKNALETIERNAKLQSELINDLLDVSRILAGTLRLNLQHVDLSVVIDAAMETVRPSAEAKQIEFVKLLDPSAGPISGDATRLQQVVWNLLSNAVKFTPKGGRIEILLNRVESHAELIVRDNGIGIAPEFLPYVFNTFRQADSSSTRQHGGLGLGLAIVRHLVELHGGTIEAHSEGEGKGATFTVGLPIRATQVEKVPALSETETGRPLAPLEGVRVLVVDDDEEARELLTRVLSNAHAEVQTAPSAQAGIQMISDFRPTIIVADIGMPGEDGYEFIRKVRELDRHAGGNLPAIALTAYARIEDRRRAILAGFQTHLAKPVAPEELIATIANLAART